MNKICNKCRELKDLSSFNRDKGNRDGHLNTCKICYKQYHNDRYRLNTKEFLAKSAAWKKANKEAVKKQKAEWNSKNKDRVKEKDREWSLANKDKISADGKKYRELHKEKRKEVNKKWVKDNSDKCAANLAKRRAAKLHATPKWLTSNHFKEIQDFYTEAKECQWLSDDKLEVDHIVPLQGKEVCGLHVPWNLRVIPASKNRSKSNKLDREV